MKTSNSSFKKALVVGIMSGMRTGSSLHFTRSLVAGSANNTGLVRFFQKKHATPGIGLLGIGELVADKLPQMPDRTAKGGPLVKGAAAALCGAAIYQADGNKALTGAVIGGLAAIASTYIFAHIRKAACKKTGVKDAYIGAAEDAIVMATGMALLKADRRTV